MSELDDDLELGEPEPDTGADEASSALDTPWRMLHPASLLVNLIPRAWATLRNLWPLVLVAIAGGTVRSENVFDATLIVFLLMMTVGNTVVHFATLRYRMHQGRLEIRTGLLNRNKRVISPRKVQNVELVRNLFHRLSGLVEVRIETASGDEVEGLLSALTVEEATRLVDALSSQRRRARSTDAPVPTLATNDVGSLVVFGATSTQFGAAAVGIGILFEVMGVTDPERMAQTGLAFGALGFGAVIAIAIVGAWALGIVNAVVRHFGFRLSLEHDALVATEGLFTRRRVELPVHKVQVVSVREPLLRRLAGISSVVVETAAARAGSGGTERALSMVPVVGTDDIDALVRRALPQADVSLGGDQLQRPDPRALRRGILRAVIQGVVLASFVTARSWPFGGLAWAWLLIWLAPGVLSVLAWLDWRHQGWALTEHVLVSRRGYLNRTTTVVARDKLQAIEVEQGPLLRRYGLGELVLRVAGSAVAMPLLDHGRAFAMAAGLTATVGREPLTPPMPDAVGVPSP